ncbi:MAG TPA: nucleoside hydrolase [Candidatus Dormibacteraeota bacterium]|nr:nucleoside hydrolase [Candidatus Dormibacteraeota bacterium]
MPRKVILDCDPGHDDAIAILLAHGDPAVELLAITTVAGNQTLDRTTLNARRVCTVAGIRDVPVAAGCDRPLLRELITAAHVHGESGLDGPSWPEPDVPLAGVHAVDLIIDLVLASDGEVTLVPTGPLTNIALAVRREPRIVSRVREVVLMGGSATRGNQTPAAEFNLLVDPEAAAIVFEAGWPLTMVGLDLTRQARVTPAVVDRVLRLGSPLSQVVVEMLEAYRGRHRPQPSPGLGLGVGWEEFERDPPLHDPCAVARVIEPACVGCVEAFVAVETQGRWTSGMTVTDFRPSPDRAFNARVAVWLDVDRFWDLVVGAIERIGLGLAQDRPSTA